jgi:hypothetical protein
LSPADRWPCRIKAWALVRGCRFAIRIDTPFYCDRRVSRKRRSKPTDWCTWLKLSHAKARTVSGHLSAVVLSMLHR